MPVKFKINKNTHTLSTKDLEVFFDTLIKSIYETVDPPEYFKCNGKKYYNHTSSWYESSKKNMTECTDYWNCTMKNRKIVDGDIEYVFNGLDKFSLCDDISDEDCSNKIIEMIENIDEDTLFKFDKKVILSNESGFNDGHRGADHTSIILDFHDEYKLNRTFTFKDFVTACFKIKSHKYDMWYELYEECVIEKNDNSINIITSFDHGS